MGFTFMVFYRARNWTATEGRRTGFQRAFQTKISNVVEMDSGAPLHCSRPHSFLLMLPISDILRLYQKRKKGRNAQLGAQLRIDLKKH